MPDQEFAFALELSDGASFEGMVNDVARTIMDAVGCPGDPAALSAVEQVLAAAGRHSRCAVRFQVRDGRLRIAVTAGGHPEWQASVPIRS
ncbi:MAG: hypothetical protein IT176_13360 [Acidobacteria bacterium]|nr:hypothetical protein [Acidobacteriota bacterium]